MSMNYEILGQISTIGVTIVGSIVIPIALYKKHKEMENNKIVFELAMNFQKDTIPHYLDILDFYKKNGLDLLETLEINVLDGKITKPKEIKQHTDEFLNKMMLLFNEMDTFASGIIFLAKEQEDKAFLMQGRAYCDMINTFKGIYDLYKLTNGQDYLNLIQLYEKWSNNISELRNLL